MTLKDPCKEVTYDFERNIWTNLVSNSSVPSTEWFYNYDRPMAQPYPILNDILTIMLQDDFDGNPVTTFTIQSSNLCSVHKRNGLSCTAEYGPCQGLGKASADYTI